MKINEQEIETFCPESQEDWRQWLTENHQSRQSVWLVYYRKKSDKSSISWSDAVDEALCFGWIDSTKKTIDEERFIQFFSKRKPKSGWSKINKEKIEKLILEKRMTQAGLDSIEKAKQNGSWTILDEVEELIIPEDLLQAFETQPASAEFFLGLSKSVRKMMLHWITFAKRAETRQKRINELMEFAAKGEKPKQFR
ncbi:YdeI/OmpD-associated family protein [Fluviicola sp.]|uniref:YdeI/OmpD-associated family protein n=1 Tax=Fluviicola sp. TaxID=1917219 RepID=UPI00263A0F04|nr:YdeI/OmpD-associated family protein [Fluviicola sp.]